MHLESVLLLVQDKKKPCREVLCGTNPVFSLNWSESAFGFEYQQESNLSFSGLFSETPCLSLLREGLCTQCHPHVSSCYTRQWLFWSPGLLFLPRFLHFTLTRTLFYHLFGVLLSILRRVYFPDITPFAQFNSLLFLKIHTMDSGLLVPLLLGWFHCSSFKLMTSRRRFLLNWSGGM